MKVPRFRFSILSILLFTVVISVGAMLYQRHVAWKTAEAEFAEIISSLSEAEKMAPRAAELVIHYPQLAKRPNTMTWAAAFGDVHVCRTFLEAGADPNALDRMDQLPVTFWPAFNNDADILKLLIDHGADTNIPPSHSNYHATLLHVAANEGGREACQVLIDHGLDINATDEAGNTPLHLATHNLHGETVNLLLEHGADIRPNHRGETPQDFATDRTSSFQLSPDEKQTAMQIARSLEVHEQAQQQATNTP